MTRSEGRWRLDALRERTAVPLSWVATIVATVAVGAFVATWLSGRPVLFVVQSTLAAALLAGLSLIVSRPLVGIVAVVGTALGAAGGALGSSLVPLVVLASVWGLGLALALAGVLVGLGARRALRRVATVGLTIAAAWGVVVVVAVLVGLAGQVLVASPDVALVEDVRDDLLPVLALAVAFSVLPALVFRWDLRELGSRQPDER
jgi:hypothetical protein